MTRLALLVTCAAAACLWLSAGASAHGPAKTPERALAHRINHYRAEQGRPKLRISRRLSQSAQRYAANLLRWDYFGHASQIQASGRWRVLGEVLAFRRGRHRSTGWAMRTWKRSAGHNAVLLDARFRVLGLGRAIGRYGRARATIWTVQLGRR